MQLGGAPPSVELVCARAESGRPRRWPSPTWTRTRAYLEISRSFPTASTLSISAHTAHIPRQPGVQPDVRKPSRASEATGALASQISTGGEVFDTNSLVRRVVQARLDELLYRN